MMVGPYVFRRRDVRHAALILRRHPGEACLVALIMGLMVGSPNVLWVVAFAAPLWVIDRHSQRLPDVLTLPFLLTALCWAVTQSDDLVLRLAGTAYLVIGMWLIAWVGQQVLGRMVLGGGDIKLIAVFPLLLGFLEANYVVLLACVLQGGLMAVLMLRASRPVAFGPALLTALVLGLAWA